MSELVPTCPACEGDGYLLGALGATWHFRCRCCGLNYTLADTTQPAFTEAHVAMLGEAHEACDIDWDIYPSELE